MQEEVVEADEDVSSTELTPEDFQPKYPIDLISDDKDQRQAIVKMPEHTVVFRELGGGDFRRVRRLSGRDVHMITDNLALYSLVKIDNEKLVPVANEMHLQARADKLTLQEYGELPAVYDQAFNPLSGGERKNV